MSDPVDTKSTESTSSSTIITIIIVSILLISCIVAIIFILRSNDIPFYPLSNFKYGDTIVIRPAILTDKDNVNQYLCQDSRYQYSNGTLPGFAYGANAYPATFTGNRTDLGSQWTLSRYSTTIPRSTQNDAENSVVAGYGNRFYLHNKNYPFANDQKGRLRYQLLNESGFGSCYNTSTAVVGGNPNDSKSWYESEILMYFMPTNYPDIYYLLFPACSDAAAGSTNTTVQPNTAIVNIRPWAENNKYNQKSGLARCYQCDDQGIYDPYTNGVINQDVMIMSMDYTGNTPPPVQPPFPQANARLFHVTLA